MLKYALSLQGRKNNGAMRDHNTGHHTIPLKVNEHTSHMLQKGFRLLKKEDVSRET